MTEFDAMSFRQEFNSALKHGNLAGAAAQLEEHCDMLLAQGRAELELFSHCAEAIPPRLQAFYPRMMLALAWRLIGQWHFSQVDDLLGAIQLRLVEMERAKIDEAETSSLRHALEHRRMMLAVTQDDMPRAEELCRQLIDGRYRTNSYVNGSLFTSLLHARREQFKFSDVDLLDTQASDYHNSGGFENALIVHSSLAALSFFALGRTSEAVDRLRGALAAAHKMPDRGRHVAAIPALPLAELLYEQASFDEAHQLVSDYLPQAHEMGIVDMLISGYLTKARLHRRAGEYKEALEVLDQAELFAAKRGFRRLSAWALAERFLILLHQGRLGTEREYASVLRSSSVERHMPGRSVTTVDEAEALAWARMAEAHCRLDDGHHLALVWSRRMHREGALRSRIRWNLMAVRFHILAGEARQAARLLRETLTIAAKGQFLSSFLEEPTIPEFLREHHREGSEGLNPEVDAFAARILAASEDAAKPTLRQQEGPASLGSLSPREIDVLTLAAAAWRNSDIADRLGLTEGTVKWYLQQIYDKLGVRKRSLAVDRARRFGIIRAHS